MYHEHGVVTTHLKMKLARPVASQRWNLLDSHHVIINNGRPYVVPSLRCLIQFSIDICKGALLQE
jgi:hypothetical protein